jgi:hypothetical protein
MGFKDPVFDAKMDSVGMVDGYAWCCLFTELCWVEAYKEFAPKMLPLLKEEFTAGTVRTFRHFKSLKWTSKTPEAGDIVIWQSYKNGKAKTSGHAAIVVKVGDGFIETIEGNTNDKGGREGYIVAKKTRTIDFTNTNGLRMLGFIKPKTEK